jgi:hypothetical protein
MKFTNSSYYLSALPAQRAYIVIHTYSLCLVSIVLGEVEKWQVARSSVSPIRAVLSTNSFLRQLRIDCKTSKYIILLHMYEVFFLFHFSVLLFVYQLFPIPRIINRP